MYNELGFTKVAVSTEAMARTLRNRTKVLLEPAGTVAHTIITTPSQIAEEKTEALIDTLKANPGFDTTLGKPHIKNFIQELLTRLPETGTQQS